MWAAWDKLSDIDIDNETLQITVYAKLPMAYKYKFLFRLIPDEKGVENQICKFEIKKYFYLMCYIVISHIYVVFY